MNTIFDIVYTYYIIYEDFRNTNILYNLQKHKFNKNMKIAFRFITYNVYVLPKYIEGN